MSREPWETKSVSQSTWKKIVHGDILKDRSDVTNVSRDTKFDLDTTGQRIGDEESGSGSEESDEDVLPSKPLSKMTLQVRKNPDFFNHFNFSVIIYTIRLLNGFV